jgi:hypothetical protein
VTWVAYHSDLSGVATFRPAEDAELKCRRYAMDNHMDVIFLPDGEDLGEAINAPRDNPEPSLLESDLAALVRETLDLQGGVRIWYSQTATDMVHIERLGLGEPSLRGEGRNLSEALTDYRIKEAGRVG